jgi:hypothetical protein
MPGWRSSDVAARRHRLLAKAERATNFDDRRDS